MRNAPPRREGPAALVYVHGVVRTAIAPRLGRSPGMPGATGGPRVVAVDERHWMVVSDVPAALYGEQGLRQQGTQQDWLGRCAAVHHDALGRATRSGPVVPLPPFTIFASQSGAVTQVRLALPVMAGVFDHLDGRVEYGMRVTRVPLASLPMPPGPTRRADTPAIGRDVLPRTLPLPTTTPMARRVESSLRVQVMSFVQRLSVDARERPLPLDDGDVWLELAVLVPAGEGPAFVRAVRTLDRELRPAGHQLTLTGPWPPLTFAVAVRRA